MRQLLERCGRAAEPHPPGPPSGLLGLGPLLAYRKDPLGHVGRLAAEYGDVAFARVGRWPSFLLNHPDHVEQVMVRRRGAYRKDPFLQGLRPVIGDGLLTSEGEAWSGQRKLMAPAFTHTRVVRHAGTMVECARAALAGWRDGEVRDVGAEMGRLSLEVAVRALFGTSCEAEARAVGEAFSVVSDHYGHSIGRLRLPRWVPTAGNRRVRRAEEELERVVARIIAERRGAPGGEDLLSRLLAARGDDGRGMGPKQLRDEVITLLLAGHETTALLLTYTWWLLGGAPGVLARLRDELDRVLGERDPTPEDLPRLVWTQQLLWESLRLYPPAAILGRQAREADEIGGWKVPAGALVFFAPWLLHRDPRFWEAPLELRPERWTDGMRAALPRFAFFPFGGGERVCIGEAFALLEARLVLATLARRVHFERVDDAGAGAAGLEVQPEITLRPVRPIRMRLVARR